MYFNDSQLRRFLRNIFFKFLLLKWFSDYSVINIYKDINEAATWTVLQLLKQNIHMRKKLQVLLYLYIYIIIIIIIIFWSLSEL